MSFSLWYLLLRTLKPSWALFHSHRRQSAVLWAMFSSRVRPERVWRAGIWVVGNWPAMVRFKIQLKLCHFWMPPKKCQGLRDKFCKNCRKWFTAKRIRKHILFCSKWDATAQKSESESLCIQNSTDDGWMANKILISSNEHQQTRFLSLDLCSYHPWFCRRM